MTIFEDALNKAGFDRLRFELKAVAPRFSREDWIAIHDEATKGMLGEGQARSVQQDSSGYAYAQPPMPEGQITVVREDHEKRADGQPIASGGQSARANPASRHLPSARDSISPMPGEGQRAPVQQDQSYAADARQSIAGEATGIVPNQGQTMTASSRDPIASGEANREVPERAAHHAPPAREPSGAELQAMKEASDLTYFEMIKLRGKAWTQYRFKQLKNVRSLNMRENALINDVIDYQRMHRIDDDKFIHLAIPSSEMRKMVRRVETAIQAKAELLTKKAKKGRRAHG